MKVFPVDYIFVISSGQVIYQQNWPPVASSALRKYFSQSHGVKTTTSIYCNYKNQSLRALAGVNLGPEGTATLREACSLLWEVPTTRAPSDMEMKTRGGEMTLDPPSDSRHLYPTQRNRRRVGEGSSLERIPFLAPDPTLRNYVDYSERRLCSARGPEARRTVLGLGRLIKPSARMQYPSLREPRSL